MDGSRIQNFTVLAKTREGVWLGRYATVIDAELLAIAIAWKTRNKETRSSGYEEAHATAIPIPQTIDRRGGGEGEGMERLCHGLMGIAEMRWRIIERRRVS